MTIMPNDVTINDTVQATAASFITYVLGAAGLNGTAQGWGIEPAHTERCFDFIQSFDRRCGGSGTDMHVGRETIFHISHQTCTLFFYQTSADPSTYRVVAIGIHAGEEGGGGRGRDPKRRAATYNIKWRDTTVLPPDSSLRGRPVTL